MVKPFNNAQEKKSCSGPWVLTNRPWDLFHQTYSKSLNTFDGTDPKVDWLKPKVRNTIFSPVTVTEYLEGPRHSKGRQELSLGQKEVGISEK